MYNRKDNWVDCLAAAIRSHRDTPFAWGEHDCMQWASKCIEAQSGEDPLSYLRSTYSTAIGAIKVLKAEGVVLPVDFADKLWGERVHIAQARLGDIVVANLGEPEQMGPSIGICYGRSSLFVGTREDDSGLVRLDTLTLEHCYQPWASLSKQ